MPDRPFVAVAEEQDKADNFQKEDAVTRGEGFPADGAARLQCAHRPVDDEDDPWTFNEITPNHALSLFAACQTLAGLCLLDHAYQTHAYQINGISRYRTRAA